LKINLLTRTKLGLDTFSFSKENSTFSTPIIIHC